MAAATGDRWYLERAEKVGQIVIGRFYDRGNERFRPSLTDIGTTHARLEEHTNIAGNLANYRALRFLGRLQQVHRDRGRQEIVDAVLRRLSGGARTFSSHAPAYGLAALNVLAEPVEITVVAESGGAEDYLAGTRGTYLPNKVVRVLSPSRDADEQASPGPLPAGDPKTVVGHAVAEGVVYALERDRQEQAQVQQQAAQQLTPFPPDPHAGERAELTRLSMEYSKQAIMNKEAGNIQKYHDWRQRQLQVERDISRLPPTPEKEYAEALRDYEVEQGVSKVTNPDNNGNPLWQHPRYKHDSPLAIIEGNEKRGRQFGSPRRQAVSVMSSPVNLKT